MNTIYERMKTLFNTGFFHIFGSSVINKVIAFLSSVILIRILTKVEYGTFTYAWNIYTIIMLLNGMGIESGVLQLASEHGGDSRYTNAISNYGVRFGLRFNLLIVGALLGIGLFAPLKIAAGRNLLCLLCILPLFQLLYNLTTSFLRAQKRNQEFAKLQLINTFLVFISSVCFSLVLRERGLVIGHYFAYICTFLVGVTVCHVHLFNKEKLTSETDKQAILKISFITMINNGLSQLLYLLDVLIIGIVDPQETILASYKVATMIPTALTFIPSSLIIYVYPYFAEHKDDGEWCLNRYKQLLIGLGSFNFVLSFLLFICAPLIIGILFGRQYLDAVPVFKLLAINYFFSGTFRIISGNLLVTQRKLTFNLFVALVSSLTNAIADFFFIKWWGSMGAAYATLLVVLLSSLLSTPYLIRVFYNKAIPNTGN